MFIGTLIVNLSMLNGAMSLKEKRMVLKSLMGRISARFNVSIAEIGQNDKWQIAIIGIAQVGNEKKFVDSSLNSVLNFIKKDDRVEIIDFDLDIL